MPGFMKGFFVGVWTVAILAWIWSGIVYLSESARLREVKSCIHGAMETANNAGQLKALVNVCMRGTRK